jgi:hypothetical protein
MPFITQNFLASTIKANGVTLSSSFDYSLLDIETNPTTFFPKTGKQKFGFTQQWGPEANQYGNKYADLGEDGIGLWNNGFDGRAGISGSGFLDLENNGPNNVANYNHQQKWTPTDEFILSPEGSRQGGNLKKDGFNFNARISGSGFLDLENNPPTSVGISRGGKEGFTPQYTPQEGQGYIVPGEAKFSKSDLVEVEPGGEVVDLGSLKVTALDIASDEAGVEEGASGGPNRIVNQSKNGFKSGQYTVTRAGGLGVGNIPGMNGQGGGVITQTLHTYTPQNPYFDAGGLNLIPIGSPQSVNQQPFIRKNNIVESNEEQGYNATIK